MDTKVNYTIVGIFVILLGAALVIVGVWIGRRGETKTYDTYAVNMGEAVSGLSLHAPVKFNGVNVGYVKTISLDPHDPRIVHLLLNIQRGTPINESTTAALDSQVVTGISYIEVKTPVPGAPPLKIPDDQRYPLIHWMPSVLFQLDTAFRDLNGNIKSITTSFNQLLNQQNLESIQKSLANIAQFTNTLATNSKAIDRITKNSALASEKLPAVLEQLQTTLVAVNHATKTLGVASGAAATTLRDSRVAVQNVSQQTLPAALETLDRLNGVLNNLQQVTGQLRNNPSLLVRGARPQTLGPGER